MKQLLITIPCHNEAVVLESTIAAVRAYAERELSDYAWEMLIIDNASTDTTYEIAKKFNVVQYSKKGRGAALRHVWLDKPGYDIYAYMDADLATDLKDFKKLVDAVAGEYDLAVGSRYLPDSQVHRTVFRKVASKIYNALAHWLLPVKFSDAQCGFKAMKGSFVRDIVPETQDVGWFWDTELMVLAGVRKKRVLEIPVAWQEVRTRTRKSTVSPWRELFRQVRNIVRLRKKLGMAVAAWPTLVLVLVGFLFLLFLGFGQVYHQDEYRWVEMVLKIHDNPVDHPPMAPFLYGIVVRLFGDASLRLVPALMGLANMVLVYLVSVRLSARRRVGILAAFLFASCSYSLIASLQIDIDGAVLPFFVLASVYCYLRAQEGNRLWLLVLAVALAGGFLTKLSFVLCAGAIAMDYAMSVRAARSWLFSGAVIAHARDFNLFNFASRAYLDLVFKVLKSFVLLSPLLALPAMAGFFMREVRRRYRLWYLFLLFNFIFYLVIFDFSTLTVERYFMFLIAPCAVIAADVLYRWWTKTSRQPNQVALAVGVALLIGTLALALPHTILPQYPKIAFVNAVRSLDFSFLLPITGGSGPAGLYVSARFILWMGAASMGALAGWRYMHRYRSFFLALFIACGLLSSLVITQEYLVGGLYGDVSKLVRQTVAYVNANPDIKHVGTYYDIGLYDLQASGKYANRFYLAPNRDYAHGIQTFRGHYMVVDFPKVDNSHPYLQAIQRCPVIKTFTEREIQSYVYDCTKLPRL